MARVGGRNLAVSWFVGILSAGIVAGLLWLALPAGPVLIEIVGDGLRQLTTTP